MLIRENLVEEKKKLNLQIEKMSVSMFTTRAKNEYRKLVDKLTEIDRAIIIFERDNVYIK